MKEYIAESPEGLKEAAHAILEALLTNKVAAFFGNMGAGKTTLIKEILKLAKVKDQVSSPTFSLVNEYETEDGKKIYHFDFYRIKHLEEAYDLGLEEYLYSENPCLIEWPEMIEDLLPEDHLKIIIRELPGGSRKITLE